MTNPIQFINSILTLDLIYMIISNVDDLKGQVVWVTGASSGIGAAIAIEAAKHGAKLVISARSEDKLRAIKQRCIGNFE